MKYIFDGSYVGLLCCVFEAFENKEFHANIIPEQMYQPEIFFTGKTIISEHERAERIITAIKKKFGVSVLNNIYQAYLSEDMKAFQSIFYVLIQLFKGEKDILNNFGNEQVVYFHQTLKKVSRERHRMKAFIRFSKSSDGLFMAVIEPDFNVLPLIIRFFKNRYTDQDWLIYDTKRNYGVHYNKISITEVILKKKKKKNIEKNQISVALDERDALFQQLWQRYFKSTNIVERKNMKLHLQHVPKRYWKYLTEKQ